MRATSAHKCEVAPKAICLGATSHAATA